MKKYCRALYSVALEPHFDVPLDALYMSNAFMNLWLWLSFSSLQLLRSSFRSTDPTPTPSSGGAGSALSWAIFLIPVAIEKVEKKDFDSKSGAMQPFSHLGARPGKMGHHGKFLWPSKVSSPSINPAHSVANCSSAKTVSRRAETDAVQRLGCWPPCPVSFDALYEPAELEPEPVRASVAQEC
jgi:hypothetical protein